MANRPLSPLESMYPARCFDCLAVCHPDKVLCEACEALYKKARR